MSAVQVNQNGRIRQSIRNRQPILWVIVSSIIALLLWAAATSLGDFPPYILPGPWQVLQRFGMMLADGSLVHHSLVTLSELVAGLVIGVFFATVLGYILAKSLTIERLLSPYIIASQAIPIVAIAPLLIIWLGPGMGSKVLICALIVFFPVLINTVVGLRSVPDELSDLMRSLLATRWQTFTYLELPAALPVFLGGLRIGATLAVIGAVVGELVGADAGLGFLINLGRGQYDTALVFVSVITLIALALILYGLVVAVENRTLAWKRQPEKLVLRDDSVL